MFGTLVLWLAGSDLSGTNQLRQELWYYWERSGAPAEATVSMQAISKPQHMFLLEEMLHAHPYHGPPC